MVLLIFNLHESISKSYFNLTFIIEQKIDFLYGDDSSNYGPWTECSECFLSGSDSRKTSQGIWISIKTNYWTFVYFFKSVQAFRIIDGVSDLHFFTYLVGPGMSANLDAYKVLIINGRYLTVSVSDFCFLLPSAEKN